MGGRVTERPVVIDRGPNEMSVGAGPESSAEVPKTPEPATFERESSSGSATVGDGRLNPDPSLNQNRSIRDRARALPSEQTERREIRQALASIRGSKREITALEASGDLTPEKATDLRAQADAASAALTAALEGGAEGQAVGANLSAALGAIQALAGDVEVASREGDISAFAFMNLDDIDMPEPELVDDGGVITPEDHAERPTPPDIESLRERVGGVQTLLENAGGTPEQLRAVATLAGSVEDLAQRAAGAQSEEEMGAIREETEALQGQLRDLQAGALANVKSRSLESMNHVVESVESSLRLIDSLESQGKITPAQAESLRTEGTATLQAAQAAIDANDTDFPTRFDGAIESFGRFKATWDQFSERAEASGMGAEDLESIKEMSARLGRQDKKLRRLQKLQAIAEAANADRSLVGAVLGGVAELVAGIAPALAAARGASGKARKVRRRQEGTLSAAKRENRTRTAEVVALATELHRDLTNRRLESVRNRQLNVAQELDHQRERGQA